MKTYSLDDIVILAACSIVLDANCATSEASMRCVARAATLRRPCNVMRNAFCSSGAASDLNKHQAPVSVERPAGWPASPLSAAATGLAQNWRGWEAHSWGSAWRSSWMAKATSPDVSPDALLRVLLLALKSRAHCSNWSGCIITAGAAAVQNRYRAELADKPGKQRITTLPYPS